MASEVITKFVRVNIDGSEVVWRSQPRAPRASSSISRYALEAGSARLPVARKMDTYYFKYGGVAEDAREARYQRTHACTYKYVFPVIRAIIRLVAAATIRERRLFRSALAQVRLLFESGVYSRGASIRSYTVYRPASIYPLYNDTGN